MLPIPTIIRIGVIGLSGVTAVPRIIMNVGVEMRKIRTLMIQIVVQIRIVMSNSVLLAVASLRGFKESLALTIR
ncbi:hypothetical protein CCP2SC5_10007 [Azospirillaceae bacterium]